jgi:hypothetical protein
MYGSAFREVVNKSKLFPVRNDGQLTVVRSVVLRVRYRRTANAEPPDVRRRLTCIPAKYSARLRD